MHRTIKTTRLKDIPDKVTITGTSLWTGLTYLIVQFHWSKNRKSACSWEKIVLFLLINFLQLENDCKQLQ